VVDYTIFVLDESDLTLSSTGLDGVTQGDGSHLNGQTLTINTPNWTGIRVTDNDVNFSDNDGSQRLDGAQEVDGVLYADGTQLEAEYSFEVSDGTDSWTVLAFNVRNSNPAYGTVEEIAVLGGPGDFPPPNTPLTISNAKEGPSYAASSYATPMCFDAGAPILTPGGYVPVDALRPGDRVETLDHGAMPVMWCGSRRAFGVGSFAPVEIYAGALGNTTRLRVSQQHRVLLRLPQAELLFGSSEVFVPAKSLLGMPGVTLRPGVAVHYHHLLLPEHAVIDCAGMATESFLPSAFGLSQLTPATRTDLERQVPNLTAYAPARPILRGYEATVLAAA